MLDILLTSLRLLACYYLSKNNKNSWPITITTSAIKIFILYQIGLSFLASSKILTLCISIHAWIKWHHQEKDQHTQPSEILHSNSKLWILPFLITPLTVKHTLIPDYNLELYTTAINLCAYFLASYRKSECWIFWIAYDCLLINLMIEKQMYLNALTTLLYLPIAFSGNYNWKKMSRTAQKQYKT